MENELLIGAESPVVCVGARTVRRGVHPRRTVRVVTAVHNKRTDRLHAADLAVRLEGVSNL
ncbi:hypothetical protein [Rhodococcus sp. USK13]|uniref:hypothetical protein n=1 Tax=Rhodococcus sp. USK13 TaxID=2806442 RepID=UPI001BCED2A5|nr:hypothetical protein [Rhodococcus sp. USK13]